MKMHKRPSLKLLGLPYEATVALVYLLFALAWIFFSDLALEISVRDPQRILDLQTYKGFAFVGVTALILFYVLHRIFQRFRNIHECLELSEERYRMLIECQSDLVVKVDVEGRFLYVSPTYCEMFGKTEDSLLGNTFMPLVHEDDVAATEEAMKSLFEPPFQAYMEQRALTKDGWRFFAWQDTAILDEEGNVKEIIGVGRDISKRKESDDRLRLATNAAQIGIWEYRFDDKRLIWDEQMFALYDVEPARFGGYIEDWESTLHPDDLESARRVFADLLRGETVYSTEFRIVWRDGSVHHIKALAEIKRDAVGHPVQAVGTNWDVSKQRQMVAALRASEQDYRQLFENMTAGFVVLEVVRDDAGKPVDYKIVQANRAAEEIGGMSRAQVVGRLIKEEFSPFETYWLDQFAQVAESGQPAVFENEVSSIGQVLSARVFQPKPGYLALVISDNTARRQAEEAYRASNERLQLATTAAQIGIWEYEVGPDRLIWDEQMFALYDMERPEFEDNFESWEKRVHPEDLEATKAELAHCIDSGSDLNLSFRIFWRDGSIHHIRNLATIAYDADGNALSIVGANWDVTESKQAERELEESRRFLRAILDMIPVGVFWKGLDFRYLGANQTFLQDKGLGDPMDIIGKDDYAINTDPASCDGYRADDRNVIESGEPLLNIEETHGVASGEIRHLLTSKIPMRNVEGEVVGVLGAYVDITQVKLLEEERHRVQRQLQHIVDNTNDMIFQIDLKGNFIYANSAAKALTGYAADELVSKNVMELILPEFQAMVQGRIENRIGGNPETGHFAFQIRHKDGHCLWVELATSGAYDTKGELESMQAVARDISTRKHAETELEESRSFLQTIINTIPARVFWKDLHSVYMGCNTSFATDSGVGDPEDLVGKSDFDMSWGEAEAELYRADDQSVIESGEPRLNFEESQTRPDGSVFWLSTSKVPIHNSVGEIIGVLGAYQDITDRKALEEERTRLFAAINQTAEAIVIMKTDGIIEYVNPAFESVTGFSRQEAVGVSLAIIKSGKHDDEFYSKIWRTIEAGKIWRGRIVNRHKDGSYYTVEAAISPVRDADGEIVNHVVSIRDISQEVELEAHMRQAQKMDAVGRLAGGVAHDFNNILQSILGFSGILLSELEAGSPQFQDVDEIRKAARRAGDLTRQLLTLSRKHNVEYAVQNLNEIIRNSERMMERLIGENIDLVFDLQADLQPVRVDLGQIEQILLNLYINARDAMPDGGTLTVATRNVMAAEDGGIVEEGAGNDHVCLCVHDTGVGIREEVREHLFEPFFTTKKVGEGTGLGLSVVYGIVQQHGGWIDVSSKVGVGAKFKVYLPAFDRCELDGSSAQEPEETTDTPLGRGEHIVVVEDDATLCDLTRRMLQDAGYAVVSAVNREQALLALEGAACNLLFSDVVLPDGTGIELARQVRERFGNIPVLLCSGYSHDAETHDSLQSNGFRYLQKPVASMKLLQTVREMLDEAARL